MNDTVNMLKGNYRTNQRNREVIRIIHFIIKNNAADIRIKFMWQMSQKLAINVI